MPATRLMTYPCTVSSAPAAIRTSSWQGSRRIPRETIRVVAAAGGWGTLSQTITPLVRTSDRAAAPVRGAVTDDARAGAASRSPNVVREIVLPVNYVLQEDTTTIRTDTGTKLDATERAAPACFELDEVEEEHGTGWSVVVRGPLVEVTGPDELDRVLAAAPTPFAAGERIHVVQLFPTAITGRWLALPTSVPPHDRHSDTNVWQGRDGDDLLA